MDLSQPYVWIAIIALIIVALLVFIIKRGRVNKMTPLASLAFVFIILGVIFGENKWTGYSLIGVGVILSIIDVILKRR